MKSQHTLPMLGLVLLFGVLFVLNSYAIFDGDYFWHVNTGQWIWAHGGLPDSDPFSFTVTDSNPFRPDSGRVPFILQQYWLGQLVLYSLWSIGGEASVVVLRALIHAGLILAVFVVSWRRVDVYRASILASLAFCHFQTVSNERPQLFTCLFAFLLVMLLERLTDKNNLAPKVLFIALPLLMLVWANMHGGYIFGLCLISAYAVGFCLEQYKSFNKSSAKIVLLLLGSGLLTMANPAGLPALLSELFAVQSGYHSQVQENVNTIKAILSSGIVRHLSYVVMALLTILSLVRGIGRIRPTHLFSICGVLALSLLAVRHQVFLFLLAPLIVLYLPFPQKRTWAMLTATSLIATLLTMTSFQRPLVFAASARFPAAAVEFVKTTKPAPNLFNYYDWGGYLALKDPESPVFVDGRGLVEELVARHDEILYEEKLSGLAAYQVNTAIFPMYNLVTGKVIPLAVMMMYDPNWQVVFMGTNSLVFLRKIPENNVIINSYAIQKGVFVRALIDAYDHMLVRYPDHYRALVTKAQLQENIGAFADAMVSLKKAQRVNPESLYTKESLQRIARKTARPLPE